VTLTELNDVERQLARKREEFERRKKLLAAGYYQQPTASS
jgi:hypothetical protein